ncbi:MAG: hypothetical protein WCJ61_05470 [Paludibacter sp.]
MKLQKSFLALLFFGIQLIATAQTKEKSIYHSDAFTISKNKVVQGKYTATALSPTEIQSDYQSMASQLKSPRITFKFSINGLDNEMLPGVNHEYVCLSETGSDETPLITFGSQHIDQQSIPDKKYLKPNTLLKIRLDMRPVLAQFNKTGYYTNFGGIKIFKSEFKGVYVVGNTAPMVWNFDNLTYHTDLQLTDPDGDGIYEVILKVNPVMEIASTLKSWKLTKDISAFPQYKSSILLENAIYNMSVEEMEKAIEKDSTLRTGIDWPGVWTRDVSYSITLSMAIMQPKVSQNSLLRKVNANGRIIQDTGTGGAWPASTDRMIWATAAWEIYKVTGDKNWLQKVYPIIKNSIEDDMMVAYDPITGMVKGESSFLDWREQTYPRWMQPADIFESENLGTNAAHYQANIVLSKMAMLMQYNATADKPTIIAQKIKAGINKHLWLKDKGYYGQYIYGRNFKTVSPRAEALGEALCVWLGIADPQQGKTIVEKTPVMEYGIPCIYPQIPGIPPYHNNAVWPFVQTYWALASAKAGNEKSVMASIAAIYRAAALFLTNKENFAVDNGDFAATQINSSNMLWSLSGNIALVQKVLFGIEFGADSLKFHPFVPASLAGSRSLTNFKYRNARLNIDMEGFGNKISRFEIDGKVTNKAAIPETLKGTHSIKMVLENNEIISNINKVKNYTTIETPQPTYKNETLSWMAIPNAKAYKILKNGKLLFQTSANSMKITPAAFAEYQVLAMDANNIASFASEPMAIVNEKLTTVYEVEKYAPKAIFNYKNYMGDGFVEMSRTINTRVNIPVTVNSTGIYAIHFRYANGNGPTNSENKCALRTLKVNGRMAGTIILPQRGIDEWSNWGDTNAVQVTLQKGKNIISLSYEAYNANMNGEINQAMLDRMSVVRVK